MSPLSADNHYYTTPKSYVLRAGRGTSAQRRSYDSFAERYIIPFEQRHLDLVNVFGNNNPVTVEIGFGMGAATAIIAAENPGNNYIGIEVHKPGIGRLLWEIEQRGLANISIIEHDAAAVIEQMIPPRSLEGIHVFFPDPWPKKRHHKRRLIKRPFTDLLASRLGPDGYLYFVTDWEDYAQWALAALSESKGLVNAYNGFAEPRTWRPRTAFEKKGLAKQHEVKELFFKCRYEEC